MGSFLSQEFAQRYPELVDKLVIVGSNGPDPLLGLGFFLAKLTVSKRSYNKTSNYLRAWPLVVIKNQSKAHGPPRTGLRIMKKTLMNT